MPQAVSLYPITVEPLDFDPSPGHVISVLAEVALGQAYLPLPQLFPASIVHTNWPN